MEIVKTRILTIILVVVGIILLMSGCSNEDSSAFEQWLLTPMGDVTVFEFLILITLVGLLTRSR